MIIVETFRSGFSERDTRVADTLREGCETSDVVAYGRTVVVVVVVVVVWERLNRVELGKEKKKTPPLLPPLLLTLIITKIIKIMVTIMAKR